MKYYLRAYGCQMNQNDALICKAILKDNGYEEAEFEGDADLVLLLTCSVRDHAEKRALGKLQSLKPSKKIGILGCMAANLKESLITDWGADFFLGPDEYRQLPQKIRETCPVNREPGTVDREPWTVGRRTGDGKRLTEDGERLPEDGRRKTEKLESYDGIYPEPMLAKRNGAKATFYRVQAEVAIMRGCDNFCSYCIVPYVRGRERSKAPEALFAEIQNLVEYGVQELTLLGQNVLNYKSESASDGLAQLGQPINFTRLLSLLVKKFPQIKQFRFLTAHPKDFSLELVELLKEYKDVISSQIHLPIQSGSNRILNLMNRGYTKEEYLLKIHTARELYPEISFTTDILVGFPTETEQDFLETIDVLHAVRFDYAYCFKYSERPNTKALFLEPKLDPLTRQTRLAQVIEIQQKITRERILELIGKELTGLVFKKKGIDTFIKTLNNRIVVVSNGVTKLGDQYKVRITGIKGLTLLGEIIP